MPHTVPSGLPDWFSLLIYACAGIGGILAVIQGFRGGKKPINAPAAIVAGDIMATKPMQDLVAEVARLNEKVTNQTAAEDRSAAALDRATAAITRADDTMRDVCRAIERLNP